MKLKLKKNNKTKTNKNQIKSEIKIGWIPFKQKMVLLIKSYQDLLVL